MQRDITCSLSGYNTFLALSQKNGMIFGKGVFEFKICILIFSTTFIEKFFVLRIIQRDITLNVKTFLCKVPVVF
jgi:hypothetical protein